MKINFDFSISQKVSSSLAIALVMIVSLVVAWYSVSAADKIIKEAPDAKAFNIEKRAPDIMESK